MKFHLAESFFLLFEKKIQFHAIHFFLFKNLTWSNTHTGQGQVEKAVHCSIVYVGETGEEFASPGVDEVLLQ